jgi:hypothetical protein
MLSDQSARKDRSRRRSGLRRPDEVTEATREHCLDESERRHCDAAKSISWVLWRVKLRFNHCRRSISRFNFVSSSQKVHSVAQTGSLRKGH